MRGSAITNEEPGRKRVWFWLLAALLALLLLFAVLKWTAPVEAPSSSSQQIQPVAVEALWPTRASG